MSKNSTRERILDAAETVFLEKGYEAASVKMILSASDAVAGSFYHFFSSKEELFEQVTERLMKRHLDQISSVFESEADIGSQIERVLALTYGTLSQYRTLMKEHSLHWTVQEALHNRTVNAMVLPLAQSLKRKRDQKEIEFSIDVKEEIIAQLIIKGTETFLHSDAEMSEKQRSDLISSYVHLLITEL